eukprot:jgi/Mesvir1/2024/Mv06786-RA.1
MTYTRAAAQTLPGRAGARPAFGSHTTAGACPAPRTCLATAASKSAAARTRKAAAPKCKCEVCLLPAVVQRIQHARRRKDSKGVTSNSRTHDNERDALRAGIKEAYWGCFKVVNTAMEVLIDLEKANIGKADRNVTSRGDLIRAVVEEHAGNTSLSAKDLRAALPAWAKRDDKLNVIRRFRKKINKDVDAWVDVADDARFSLFTLRKLKSFLGPLVPCVNRFLRTKKKKNATAQKVFPIFSSGRGAASKGDAISTYTLIQVLVMDLYNRKPGLKCFRDKKNIKIRVAFSADGHTIYKSHTAITSCVIRLIEDGIEDEWFSSKHHYSVALFEGGDDRENLEANCKEYMAVADWLADN